MEEAPFCPAEIQFAWSYYHSCFCIRGIMFVLLKLLLVNDYIFIPNLKGK